METTMNINVRLSVLKYATIVNSIADGYFDFEGNYIPHIGVMNAMRIFWNECVTEIVDGEEIIHEVTELTDLDEIIADGEFEKAFHEATEIKMIRLDFANAVRDAIDIVNVKKNSVGRISDYVSQLVDKISNGISNITPEQMDTLKKVSEQISDGTFNADTLLETFGETEMFKKILASRKKITKPKGVKK